MNLQSRSFIVSAFSACGLFVFSGLGLAQTASNICTQQQCVKIQNGSLQVLSADNATYQPFFIKAVGYEPTPIGRYPSDWGYASTDPRSANNNIYDDPDILNRDFLLLQQMNANAIRVWNGADNKVSCQCTNNGRFTSYITNASTTANADTTQNTLDLANQYGLKVIAGFWINPIGFDASNNIYSTDDNGDSINSQQIINNFVAYVNTFKANRAILFWAIGNENNYQVVNGRPVPITAFENAFGTANGDSIYDWLSETANIMDYDGDILVNVNTPSVANQIQTQYPADYTSIINLLDQYAGQPFTPAQLTAWYGLIDAMAKAAHNAEGATFHPVAVVNGGMAEIGNSTDGAADAQLPDLDIWGVNDYPGQTFGNAFSTYATLTKKPLWISEFGADAWSVTGAVDINNWGLTLSADLGGTGSADPGTQAAWDVGLWNEISNNYPVTIGGSVMEYSDEWWKPYEFYCTTPSAGQVNNDVSAGICNSNQKYFGLPSTGAPDGFSNEEWYGVMSISANPTVGGDDLMSPRLVYSALQTQWQNNPWATLALNISGSGAGTIASLAGLGAGLNCVYPSSSGGVCSTAFRQNQPVTLSFSSSNNSTVTNWGVSSCSAGSNSCTLTPSGNMNLNVTLGSTARPSVSLNSYIYFFTAPAVAYLVATASEPGGTIGKVEFYNGTNLVGTVTAPEWDAPNYDFLWSNLAPGNYSMTAKAYDQSNNVVASQPVTFTVSGLPSVGLSTNPTTATAPASITLTANATESFGTITQVNFYNGSTLLGTASSTPFTFTWNNVPVGTYTLTAQAVDKSNNIATSTPVSVVVGTASAPAASLTSPANGSSYTLPASITLSASASSSKGISNVAFYSGTTLLGTAAGSPYTLVWSGMSAGPYSLMAVATDTSGTKSTSAPVSITVNPHPAPSISITSPVNNASYNAPASIVLSANASAANASISSVSFYNGTTLIGTVTSSPYTYTWSNVPAGSYNLTAVATDSTGAAGTSVPVAVRVNAHVAPTVALYAYIYSYTAPTDVYLVAQATEAGGTVSKVEFYNGTTLVATSSTPEFNAPNYDYLWFNLPAGNYNLTAKAYDANGNTSVSTPATFTVVSAS